MKKLAITPKRWLLSLHLLFSAILLGTTVVFLILGITALLTDSGEVLNACYIGMHILSKTSVRASTIGVVVTGILLSLLTKWGMFKFYWIIAKEVLTLVVIGLSIVGLYIWTLKAVSMTSEQGINALQHPDFTVNNVQLFAGISLQILSLAAMFVISVFKPWGRRKP